MSKHLDNKNHQENKKGATVPLIAFSAAAAV
jgi:hypothetical protein